LPEDEVIQFKKFVANEAQKWKDGNYSNDVRFEIHSNNVVNDVSRFMNVLLTTMSI
jgi:hypothetical protein